MTRASRARRIASAAMYGGGGLVGVGATIAGVLFAEVKLARRAIGDADGDPHDPDGHLPRRRRRRGRARRPPRPRRRLHRRRLRRRLPRRDARRRARARPVGAARPSRSTPRRSPRSARRAATSTASSTACSAAPASGPTSPSIMIGANDVTHGVRPAESVRHLAVAVAPAARGRHRGRRRHLPRPRHRPPDPPPAAPGRAPLGPLARRRADHRRRRGGRPLGVARRPARPRVRARAARVLRPGPLPPVGRRLRGGGRRAAARRSCAALGADDATDRGRRRRGEPRSCRSPTPRSRPSTPRAPRSSGVAGRRTGARSARPLGRACAPP